MEDRTSGHSLLLIGLPCLPRSDGADVDLVVLVMVMMVVLVVTLVEMLSMAGRK